MSRCPCRTAAVLAALASVAALAAAPDATALAPRHAADLPAEGTWTVGVFSPLRWVVSDGVELETHPLVTLVAPHLTARVAHRRGAGLRLTGVYGLGLPTTAFALAPPGVAGYLGPSCKVQAAETERGGDCERPGATLVADAGVVASIGDAHVTTARADVAVGVLLGDARARPFDTWTPLDLLLAPIARGWRGHLSVRHDRALHQRVRASVELHLWQTGRVAEDSDDRSLTTFGAHVGVDIGVTASSRVTLGALYTNADTRASAVEVGSDGYAERVFVRSQDVWPTLDWIWQF